MLFTRFAPSPTGYLHRGHLLSALFVFAAADLFSAKVRLRIEDHDQSRARKEYIDSIPEDLERFGFKFESASLQSNRQALYEKYAQLLFSKQKLYPCSCSRKKLFEENPINADGEVIYSGHCLKNPINKNSDFALRFKTPDKNILWEDLLLGKFEENPKNQCGDFTIKDRISQWTYQFAVCVDDLEENIGLVVRGEDLRNSTARQIVLSEALGRKTPPLYLHHPLLTEKSGEKLSKRQHSKSLRAELEQGLSIEDLLGLVCYEAHSIPKKAPLTLNEAIYSIQKTYFSCFLKK
jgi:glutamyl-tRNA synthetase/glutamyl-Q tRNA(Asp) synthetase